MDTAFHASPTGQDSSLHAGLARISGYSAAIAAETNRLCSIRLGDPAGHEPMMAVMSEMRAMAQLLAESRAEIIAMSPPPGGEVQLHEVNDALDAVVGETERATFEIMNQAERAQAAAVRLHAGTSTEIGADLAEVNEAATAITLACTFQDITGQRIRKVMSTMRDVEARVASLVSLMGIEANEVQASSTAPRSLLNGPSTAAEGGLGQGAVDDLFA